MARLTSPEPGKRSWRPPPAKIRGWGVDADPAVRPGVPAEVPATVTGALPQPRPPQQTSGPRPVVGAYRAITPVYSTAVPPRGLSGRLRRVAYDIPEYKARRWLLLLTADRVDALGHGRLLRLTGALALGAAALYVLGSLARSRRSRWGI